MLTDSIAQNNGISSGKRNGSEDQLLSHISLLKIAD
jgi:hypothetical protein